MCNTKDCKCPMKLETADLNYTKLKQLDGPGFLIKTLNRNIESKILLKH